jgi:D-tyrosyl-tRNA(Tyr) deacylase
MKVVVQRSLSSNVIVEQNIVGSIKKGVVLLVGFTNGDTEAEIDNLVKKIINLRIFDDEFGIMNKSLLDTSGEILSISQFTLYGDTKKGNRPSYINAMNGSEAINLFNSFNKKLSEFVKVETGVFGAEMLVNIVNDGPVTILLESEVKK